MASFPTLSILPSFPLKESREDSVIESKMEGGYQVTRQRFSRIRRKWVISYPYLVETDVTALRTFLDTTVKGGADMFTWIHPETGSSYTVRFEKSPVFASFAHYSGSTLSSTEISLVEV